MEIIPLSLKDANRYIMENHRHHSKVQGHKYSLGLVNESKLIGVCCVGRPVSRHADNGLTLEVTRLCTDGTKNACSKLYSAAARVAKEMGYNKIITYILESESGHSLVATGWECEDDSCGGTVWKRNDGHRTNEVTDLFGITKKYPNELKQRWSKKLNNTK